MKRDETSAHLGKAIILLSHDLSHPALAKQQFDFSWRINRLKPLLRRGYTVIVVAAGGTVGKKGRPTLSSLRPRVKNDGGLVLISPPILRIPMLWLLQSVILTPLVVLLYCRSKRLDVEAVVAASVAYGAVGKVLNKFLKAALIVDYGDPDYVRERGFSLRVLHLLETYVLGSPGVDAVTCIDPNICAYVKRFRETPATFLPPGGYWKDSFRPLQGLASPGDGIVLYAGHLASPPTYRLDLLMDAAPRILSKNPDARLAIIGDGEYLETLRKRAESLKILDRVEIPGGVSYEMAKKRIAEADVAVQVLNDMCLGTKVMDYFALGKAVVSCGKFYDSYSEFLKNGENCVLVPPDAAKLADAISLLLSDRSLKERMGKNALETVSKYDWDSQANEILALIQESASRQGS
jgi:glycosyltransferase involved in cell wall biosynthesis